jgi:hypothetical protein
VLFNNNNNGEKNLKNNTVLDFLFHILHPMEEISKHIEIVVVVVVVVAVVVMVLPTL